MYYVYELIDPRDDSVFYIGKGKDARVNAHELEAKAGRVSRKCNRIRDIEAAGLKIGKRKVKHFQDEQEAYDYEASLIETVGLANLTNAIAGGGTASGRPTLAHDRDRIKWAAEFTNRTRGGAIAGVMINGQRLDLVGPLENLKRVAAEVISRRGMDWANNIATRFNVQFVPKEA